MMEDWFTHSDMPESWMLATSPAGFCEDSQCEGFPKGKHRNLMKLGP